MHQSRQGLTSRLRLRGQTTVPEPVRRALKVTAGDLEGELIGRQSTAELTRRYQVFSRDEIRYRLPNGENLHDISTRV